ncbi:MAG: diacylglycerol kinase family protein [Coriobacteriia bacterium]|nr:diacylglycerol kinase family protein [Coriobacteriia bacterium]
MRLLIINNLASGYQDGAIFDFVRVMAKDGDEVVVRSTDGTSDLRTFLTDANQFDLVVASGGDGTVATVCYALAYTNTPVLPFPSGTANLLALNLDLPNEVHALAKLARTGKMLDFDLGEFEIQGGKYGFGIMAGAGYDATIMKGAKPAKRHLGPLAYFGAAATNLTPQHSRFLMTLDGVSVESEGVGVLIVNFSKIQFDMSVTHTNEPRNGMLDVVVLKAPNAIGLLPTVGAVLLDRDGSFPDRPDLEIHRVREATIVADPPLFTQYDGEVTELTTPFTVRVLPRAVKMVVSESGYKLFADVPLAQQHIQA